MNDVTKIMRSCKECGLLKKSVRETIKNEWKEQKGGFLRMLGTLSADLLGNPLIGKDTTTAGKGAIATSQGKGTIRRGQDF